MAREKTGDNMRPLGVCINRIRCGLWVSEKEFEHARKWLDKEMGKKDKKKPLSTVKIGKNR